MKRLLALCGFVVLGPVALIAINRLIDFSCNDVGMVAWAIHSLSFILLGVVLVLGLGKWFR